MSEAVVCPNCHEVAGFRSMTREKVREIRLMVGKMNLPNIDLEKLETFGFCPWCGYPIKLEDKSDESQD